MKLELKRITGYTASVLLLAGLSLRASAQFQSQQVAVIGADAEVGGTAPLVRPGFEIIHTPLQGISNITKIGIIEGAVGTNVPAAQSKSIQSRNVHADDATPVIRIRLRFRFVDSTTQTPGDVHELKYVFYNDPSTFVFNIDPSLIEPGQLQYELLAERFDANGVVISTFSVPVGAYADPDNNWITVGVAAGAAPLIGPEGGTVAIPDGNPNDGQSSLNIPAGTFNSPTAVSLAEVPADQAPKSGSMPPPLAVYSINSQVPFNGSVRVSVLYPEFQPTTSGWTLSGSPVNDKNLTLAFWDGFSWHPLYGSKDTTNHLLSSRISYVPYLGVFPSAAATPSSVAPVQKIITPNGDGRHDTADFQGIDPSTIVKIFDVAGNKIRTLDSSANGSWDGRDDNGKVVESGVYIYQFTQSGERISGVIAVAK